MRYLLYALVILAALDLRGADWIRPGLNTNQPVWGLRGGLIWAVPPGRVGAGSGGIGGPRGLLRLGYPTLPDGQYDLINFIAVEPAVKEWKGLSELEHSALDNTQGKRIWAGNVPPARGTNVALEPGILATNAGGVEELTVTLRVERFDNWAHVWLTARQRADRPDELELAVHAETNSAPMDYCVLTATMGNKARTRQLWLQDTVVSSLQLYPNYQGLDFAPHAFFPLARLARTAGGDVLLAATTDEADPAAVRPLRFSKAWYYGGGKVTQYWRKPAGAFRDDLHAAVNGRYAYWKMDKPIPGGIAFENIELRERFYEGQRFVFGITRKTPAELGVAPDARADRLPPGR